jgi:hypothetical protein
MREDGKRSKRKTSRIKKEESRTETRQEDRTESNYFTTLESSRERDQVLRFTLLASSLQTAGSRDLYHPPTNFIQTSSRL